MAIEGLEWIQSDEKLEREVKIAKFLQRALWPAHAFTRWEARRQFGDDYLFTQERWFKGELREFDKLRTLDQTLVENNPGTLGPDDYRVKSSGLKLARKFAGDEIGQLDLVKSGLLYVVSMDRQFTTVNREQMYAVDHGLASEYDAVYDMIIPGIITLGGSYGHTRNSEAMDWGTRMRLGLYYAAHASLTFDNRMMGMTAVTQATQRENKFLRDIIEEVNKPSHWAPGADFPKQNQTV